MILLIDNYDSFVFNVEQYIRELTTEEVSVIRNDKITISSPSVLFKELPEKFNVMRYHSLYVDKATLPDSLEILAETEDEIIMALKHNKYNFFGIQFHPESYFTEYGKKMIDNFINYQF